MAPLDVNRIDVNQIDVNQRGAFAMKLALRTAILALACGLGLNGCILAAAGIGAGAGYVASDSEKNSSDTPKDLP
jgi:hypothetical protein